MARVEEDARKAQDAERLQQKIEREARDAKTGQANRDAFSKLVKGNQQQSAQTAKAKTDQKSAQQSEQQGAKVAKEQLAQNQKAKTARSSVQTQSKAMEQARSFQGVLAKQESSTKQTDNCRVESRDDGNKNDRVERDDREVDLKRADTKRDVEQENARVEAREQARPNAAIESRGGDASGGDGRGDDRGAQAIAMKAGTVQQAQQASAAHQVKQIPPELLEKLVSAVYLGVNEKGLKEFQIELKDGPLKGAAMRISADDGKVSLSFSGLDADTKRLVEASKGDLMRRLSSKGLTLSRLDVK